MDPRTRRTLRTLRTPRHSGVAHAIGAVVLVGAAVAAALAGGCHTMDRYRPAPPRTPAVVAADPRPDLPGRPLVMGDALYRAADELALYFPTARPVVVRWTPLADPYLGCTHESGGGHGPAGELLIEVRDDLPAVVGEKSAGWIARDILIHEYAHALAWDAPESAHGPVWASYFGLIYKATRGER